MNWQRFVFRSIIGNGLGDLINVSKSFWYRNVILCNIICLFCFGVASLKNRLAILFCRYEPLARFVFHASPSRLIMISPFRGRAGGAEIIWPACFCCFAGM